jgi:glycosyltransferase involved in cell wall biosynthesis
MIDVIIPIFNNSATLDNTLASVVRQSIFSEVRVLISDDCSSDGSSRLIEKWCKEFKNIEFWRNDVNLGVMGNYRKLASESGAEFIAPIEGDDVWLSIERLAILRRHLSCSKLTLCFNRYLLNNGSKYTVGVEELGQRYRIISAYELISKNYPASFSNCFYYSDTFRSGLSRVADQSGYDWLLNTVLAHSEFGMGFVPEILSSYYISPTGTWSSLSIEKKSAMISSSLEAMKLQLPREYRQSLECKLNEYRTGR